MIGGTLRLGLLSELIEKRNSKKEQREREEEGESQKEYNARKDIV